MRFLWFWSFWHWSQESFRDGAMLNEPFEEFGSYWDEWFLREASAGDIAAVESAANSAAERKGFILWLVRRWYPTVERTGNRHGIRFVLRQLAAREPFATWPEFELYSRTYRSPGIRPVILGENSPGEKADVRAIEAILFPLDRAELAAPIRAEGFRADRADLEAPWLAAGQFFEGSGRNRFIVGWILRGIRPHSKWVRGVMAFGWALVAGLLALLLWGPEPGGQLEIYCAILIALWLLLVASELGMIVQQCRAFVRDGHRWADRLRRNQARLRLEDNIIIKGGSAGLAFCLNIILATLRSEPGRSCAARESAGVREESLSLAFARAATTRRTSGRWRTRRGQNREPER